ncbi:hypothetical protein LZ30DRAFT_700297 [Colletotrichum cereale]|nr:hypothetical protein LZ30DRAFT_700297 [Colletotrichum cereale]
MPPLYLSTWPSLIAISPGLRCELFGRNSSDLDTLLGCGDLCKEGSRASRSCVVPSTIVVRYCAKAQHVRGDAGQGYQELLLSRAAKVGYQRSALCPTPFGMFACFAASFVSFASTQQGSPRRAARLLRNGRRTL